MGADCPWVADEDLMGFDFAPPRGALEDRLMLGAFQIDGTIVQNDQPLRVLSSHYEQREERVAQIHIYPIWSVRRDV